LLVLDSAVKTTPAQAVATGLDLSRFDSGWASLGHTLGRTLEEEKGRLGWAGSGFWPKTVLE
jgi:hypothetical protein